MVNGLKVIDNAFESSPGFLTHKVLDKIGEIPVSSIIVENIKATTAVLNETLAALFKLTDESIGLKLLKLDRIGEKVESELSEYVTDLI